MFNGSITALITPFDESGVDKKALADLVEWQIKEGTNGLVPVGTTGESPTVSHAEHRQIVSKVIEIAAGRVPVMVVASAGTANAGTVDPLSGIAAVCRTAGVWFHIDGAYGAPAALTEAYAFLREGFAQADSARLASSLGSMASLGPSFLITASRRTPSHALDAVLAATSAAKRIVWEGAGTNPYESWLAHADMFVVTADSINMTGEACASGKPVYVFEPDGGSAKFSKFHESLRRYGATRELPEIFTQLETWVYTPLDSAAQIAEEIERRWRRR